MKKFVNNESQKVVSAVLIASVAEGMAVAVDSEVAPIAVSPSVEQRLVELAGEDEGKQVYLVDVDDVFAASAKADFDAKYTEQVEEPEAGEAEAAAEDDAVPGEAQAEPEASEVDQEKPAQE